jgi:four helix bundle protein
VIECYKITRLFPGDEKFALVQQIRRAALSVHLNIAEGCSRKSRAERIRYFEIARGSVIEIDTAIEIAYKLSYFTSECLQSLGNSIINTFKLLTGMIGLGNINS